MSHWQQSSLPAGSFQVPAKQIEGFVHSRTSDVGDKSRWLRGTDSGRFHGSVGSLRSDHHIGAKTVSSTVLYMSMSLDGFIAGPNESMDNGLGDGGDRLHEWVFPGAEGGDFDAAVARLRGVNRQIYDEFMSTGAVVAGRGTFEPAGGWGGDHHDGVPIYILSRNPAPSGPPNGLPSTM